jgi:dienelactone hydrolase
MTHPWNGSIWTYAAYAELLDEAAKRDVVLLFPSGLGNSLYTAPAEDEVLRAIDALEGVVAVDPARVSIAGASMGGAGATTIGFHSPDRFASITSLFGDSKYDLSTYVHAILRDETGARRVNAMDVVENARNVPVWLIHGEDDRVSAIVQSEALAQVMRQRGFAVRFDRIPGAGHEGALVARFAREIVARASELRAATAPARVSYRSVRAEDHGAYGVTLERVHPGDAFVDVERVEGGLRVHRADNVRAITLAAGAMGLRPGCAVARDAEAGDVRVVFAGTAGAQ